MTQGITSSKTQRSGPAQEVRVEPMAVCSVCGWRAEEPPGACAKDGCGLKDAIRVYREDLRVRLGLPTSSQAAEDSSRLVARSVTASTARKTRPRPAIRQVPACTAPEAPAPEEPPAGGVTLMDLGRRSCRWPLGDPLNAGFRYCGARSAQAGSPYCRHHRQLAWRSPGGRNEQ